MLFEKAKFLEGAIKITTEEVLEELAVLKEQKNIDHAIDMITKIMKDLLNTTEEFDSHLLEELNIEKENEDDKGFLFKIGSKVKVIENGFLYTGYKQFAEKHGHPEAASRKTCKLKNGDVGKIIARGSHLSKPEYGNIYIFLREDQEKFIIGEDGLKHYTSS